MPDTKISVDLLLAKIGQLVIQLEVAESQIAELRAKVENLTAQKEQKKESTAE
jgi:hypothetical protein